VASDGRFRTDVEGRPDLPVRSALYAPMVHQGRVVGVLQLLNRSGVDGFTEADGEVAAYVAGAAAEVIGPSVSGP
jgi:GAF domain-containing protein